MNETVLVTGGAGFIGSYIVAKLVEQGCKVVIFDYVPPNSETKWLLSRLQSKPIFVKGDITDHASIIYTAKTYEVENIIHTAALTDVNLLLNDPIQSLKINALGSVNVLETARILGLRKVILTSSIAVYAPKQYEPMDELHPVLLPNQGPALTSYSSTKLAAEAFAMFYWADHGLDVLSLRFSGVYGFGMKYPLYIKPILENALNGIPTHIESGGDAKRDFVYVKDVANAVFKAFGADGAKLESRIFNIAHGGPLLDVFHLAEEVRAQIKGTDIFVGSGLSESEAKIERSRGQLSIVRAAKELGYKPEFDLAKGIKDYVRLFRDYGQYVEGGDRSESCNSHGETANYDI